MKRIGIIGSGAVAKTLASGYIKHGYDVMMGTRTASKLDEWKAKHEHGKVGSFDEAAGWGELLVLAVKGSVAKDALIMMGKENLKGKTIIDTTNPIASEIPPVNGVLSYFTPANSSLHEDLQHAFPEAHFVKCYNSVGSPFMVDPDFGGVKPTMFICGNSDAAKMEVKEILAKTGWETEDMGKAEAARGIEPLCVLWCTLGFNGGGWSHAFKLLKK
ncbi:MAG TPA: NAD(P)-binding domain-containing protein [Bacteroidia bacterium]